MNGLAILVAAGLGERMGAGRPKAFLTLGGEPILLRAARPFAAAASIDAVVVVVPAAELEAARSMLAGLAKLHAVVPGGARRQDSVLEGLRRAPEGFAGVVLVHDAARPFADPALIDAVAMAAREHGAALPLLAISDTIKRVRDGRVVETIERSELGAAQTPQGFRFELLARAYEAALRDRVTLTDEAAAVERLGQTVAAVPGSLRNRKLTTPEDLAWAEWEARGPGAVAVSLRAGTGFDAHRLVPGRALMLGGVRLDYERGLAGHSDGDCLLHALCDALLGAAGAGDMGRHFPSSDERFKGVASLELLSDVARIVQARGYAVLNVDATLIAEAPPLAPHLDAMREAIARRLGIALDAVSVKAKSSDGLGAIGRGEGIAAQAVALLRRA